MADEDKPVEEVAEETPFDVEPVQPEIEDDSSSEPPKESSAQVEDEPKGPNIFQKFWAKYKAKKKIAVPLTVIAAIVFIFAIPVSRYAVAGVVVKKDLTIYIVDDQTKTPVRDGFVYVDGKTTEEHLGREFSNVSVGKHKIKFQADHYASKEVEVTVDLGKAKNKNIEIQVTATGRRVSFHIDNSITHQPISKNVLIKTQNSETTSADYGNASLVVDPNAEFIDVEVSAEGYNTVKTKARVHKGNFSYEVNTISLTPKGKVYFLSKSSGKIDVVKTDLDGSNRQTVLAGTGSEEDTNTVLLASRDWKYLALQSRRDAKAKLYLIDTSTDKLTEIDSGDATYTPVGWQDHYFVYQVYRDNVPAWQGKNAALKTFNAENLKLTVIDETTAEGTSTNDYASDAIESVYIQKDSLVYIKRWSASYYSVYRLAGKRTGIYSAKLSGTSKLLLKDFDAGNNTYVNAVASKPDEIYYGVYGAVTSYFEYEDGKLSEAKDVTDDWFTKFYPTYLLSPSGQTTFWYEPRDGKNTLFTGTQDGSAAKEIASLSEYIPYGWYSDNYLLVSKDGSELYILPTAGPGEKGQILKIADYHKPAINFYGYGGGYGGF